MKLFIKPNDVLFFRDGKPFDAGDNNTARISFPPSPTTFYGAIRSAIMNQNNINFSDLKKNPMLPDHLNEVAVDDKIRTLEIQDFGLAAIDGENIERIFPVPLDIVKEKDKNNFFILSPQEMNQNIKSNFPYNSIKFLNISEDEIILDNCNNYFIKESGLTKYLINQNPDIEDFIKRENVFLPDNRTGIKRNDQTFTSEDGFIYSIEFASLNKGFDPGSTEYGFVINTNSTRLKTNGSNLLRLGGEARTAFYQIIDGWNEIPKPEIKTKFKLILLTPAIFERGWVPDFLNEIETENYGKKEKVLMGNFGDIKFKLVSAAIDRYIGIGGWDILNNRSKPLQRAVPAGSVYFFECIDGQEVNQEKLIENFYLESIMNDNNLRKEGLGLTYIGAW